MTELEQYILVCKVVWGQANNIETEQFNDKIRKVSEMEKMLFIETLLKRLSETKTNKVE